MVLFYFPLYICLFSGFFLFKLGEGFPVEVINDVLVNFFLALGY